MNWHGEEISVGKLVQHYRLQARNNPRSASFWRTLTRTVIAEYREQSRESV